MFNQSFSADLELQIPTGQNPISSVLPFFDEDSIANEPEFIQQTESDEEVSLLQNIDKKTGPNKVSKIK